MKIARFSHQDALRYGIVDDDHLVVLEGDFIFVTNNAADFRRLYRGQPFHAGLVIIVPQVPPSFQRQLFVAAIDEIGANDGLLNEALEVLVEDGDVIFNRYVWPAD